MKIIILSKSEYIYSTQALKHQLNLVNMDVQVINPLECTVIQNKDEFEIIYQNTPLEKIDYVIPRIGAASDSYGLYVLNALEQKGIKTLNSSKSIELTRDKFSIYAQLLKANLQVPSTALIKSSYNIDYTVNKLGGFPLIIKLTRGSQGKGVMIAENMNTLKGIVDSVALFEENLIIQEYIETNPVNSDIRLYILDKKVIGATQRQNKNDFRSNSHCGGDMSLFNNFDHLIEPALKASDCFGLNFCTVDFLINDKKSVILEINSTPGFENVENQAGLNLSSVLTSYIQRELCLTTTKI